MVCDLDGVVWLGGEPLPGAAEAIAQLRAAGVVVAFLTNNSSERVATYCARLERIGVPATPEEMMTSAQAAALLLAGRLPAAAHVLACAGEGVTEALTECGLVAFDADRPAPGCAGVVVGWHRHFDFNRLSNATRAVISGALFVATNTDPTYPAPDGLLPGNGALVAAVATAAGSQPLVAGKPEAPTVAMVRRRFGDRGVVVGDRPSTDGALARDLGWPFALVVSEATLTETDPATADAEYLGGSLAAVVGDIVDAFTATPPRTQG